MIKNNDVNHFFNRKFDEIEEEYGQYHVDIGSGFFLPSYITEDAYLITLGVTDGDVETVTKYDLLTGEIIEEKY